MVVPAPISEGGNHDNAAVWICMFDTPPSDACPGMHSRAFINSCVCFDDGPFTDTRMFPDMCSVVDGCSCTDSCSDVDNYAVANPSRLADGCSFEDFSARPDHCPLANTRAPYRC